MRSIRRWDWKVRRGQRRRRSALDGDICRPGVAQGGDRGFTLVEVLIVVVVLGILASIVVPQFANASDAARNASAAQIVQSVQQQIALYRAKHGAFPDTIDLNWFTPPRLPENPYLPGAVELVVQNIAGKTELDSKHTNKGPIIWWYNRATGAFHTRVPWQGSNEATLALYDQVNHCTAANP